MISAASSAGTVMIATPATVSETTGQRIAITPSARRCDRASAAPAVARVRRAGGWLISLDGRARLAAGFHAATPVQLVIGFGDTDARAIADGVAAIAPLLG